MKIMKSISPRQLPAPENCETTYKNLPKQVLENNGNVKTNCRHTMNTHTQTRNINAKPCQKQPDKAAIHIHIIFSSVNRFWKATESIRKHCNSMKHHKKHQTQDQCYLAVTQIRIRKPQKAIGDHWKQ